MSEFAASILAKLAYLAAEALLVYLAKSLLPNWRRPAAAAATA